MKGYIAFGLIVLLVLSGCGEESTGEVTREVEGDDFKASVTVDSLNCNDDMDCLSEAAENCEKAKAYIDYDIDAMGMIQKGDIYFEIKGEEDGKCVIYERIDDLSIEFTDEFIQSISQIGTDGSEMSVQLEAMQDEVKKVIGKDVTCKIPMSNLAGSSDLYEEMGQDGLDCEGSLIDVQNSLS